MRVAAIGAGREGAVVEGEKRGIGAFGRARAVPIAGLRAHRANLAAAEKPHDVDLMRRLAEHHAAALRGVELLRAARADRGSR